MWRVQHTKLHLHCQTSNRHEYVMQASFLRFVCVTCISDELVSSSFYFWSEHKARIFNSSWKDLLSKKKCLCRMNEQEEKVNIRWEIKNMGNRNTTSAENLFMFCTCKNILFANLNMLEWNYCFGNFVRFSLFKWFDLIAAKCIDAQ